MNVSIEIGLVKETWTTSSEKTFQFPVWMILKSTTAFTLSSRFAKVQLRILISLLPVCVMTSASTKVRHFLPLPGAVFQSINQFRNLYVKSSSLVD